MHGRSWSGKGVATAAAVAIALLGVGAPAAHADDSATPTPTATPTATPTGAPTGTSTGTSTTPPVSGTPTPGTGQGPVPTSPSSSPSSSAPTNAPAPPGDGEQSLTPAQVHAELAQAAALGRSLLASNAQLAAIGARVAQLSTQSAAALQALQQATQAEAAAASNLALEQERLSALEAQVTQIHNDFGRWASQAYIDGGELARYDAWITALQGRGTDDVGGSLVLLNYVGESQNKALTDAETLAEAQRVTALAASLSEQQAAAAKTAATAANAKVQTALTAQRAALAQEQTLQSGSLDQAALTQAQLARLHSADAIAAREALAAAAGQSVAGSAGAAGASGTCRPGAGKASTAGYANGQIPRSVLCPLWGAPGQLLRGDAAAAFDKLSRSYAETFGTPICVTDSYRSYSEQVALYAEKPNLAARPGTSNHGLGVAVDLCGGIQSFGTTTHAWMLAHAPLFGWFHPAWAEPGGSRPEPWHWEFAG